MVLPQYPDSTRLVEGRTIPAMLLTTTPIGIDFAPAAAPVSADTTAAPTPPTRWTRYWKTPIAHFDYGNSSRMPLWAEATIPAERNLTGAKRPSVTYAGTTLAGAIEAAHLLARDLVDVSFSFRNGRVRTTQVHPAFGVLRDSAAGAFWLTPLHTTVKLRNEWLDAPHAIDGPAFDGADAVLARPEVRTATRDLVAVVGAREVIRPDRWTDAPDDSLGRA